MKANLVNNIYVYIYFRPFLNCLDADDPYLARKFILRDKTMAKKFMYFPNDDKQNYPFSRLKQLLEKLETNSF